MKFVIVAMLFVLSTPAYAQSSAQAPVVPVVPTAERDAIARLLSAIHELPPKAQFEAASTNPAAVVYALAAGQGPIADRAVEAMFMWPSDQTFAIAQAQLADATTKRGRKHRLLMFTAETYGDRATPLVAPYLGDADPQLRVTAAAAIAKIRTDAAFSLLDAAIAGESNALVADEMRRYTRRVR